MNFSEGNNVDDKELTKGILAEEAEHCAHLEEIGRLAREAGHNVPGAGQLPELLPDGSYVQEEVDD